MSDNHAFTLLMKTIFYRQIDYFVEQLFLVDGYESTLLGDRQLKKLSENLNGISHLWKQIVHFVEEQLIFQYISEKRRIFQTKIIITSIITNIRFVLLIF